MLVDIPRQCHIPDTHNVYSCIQQKGTDILPSKMAADDSLVHTYIMFEIRQSVNAYSQCELSMCVN